MEREEKQSNDAVIAGSEAVEQTESGIGCDM